MTRPRHVKFVRDAKRYAERCGVQDITVGYCRRHPIIRGRVNGKAVRVVIPGTPGDQRSWNNTFADLRRAAREARS